MIAPTSDPNYLKLQSNIEEVLSRGGAVIAITEEGNTDLDNCDFVIKIPTAPLLAIPDALHTAHHTVYTVYSIHCTLLNTHYSLHATCPYVRHLLPTTYYPLPTTYCLLFTAYRRLPTTYCLQPNAHYFLRMNFYLLPATD